MNTDDNERLLASAAMHAYTYPSAKEAIPTQTQLAKDKQPLRFLAHGVGIYEPPHVKGFDAAADKAERKRAKRARKLAKKRG